MIWTDELKAEVFELWKKHSATQIAAILAEKRIYLNRNQIIGAVHRAGLSGHEKLLEHPLSRSNGQRRPKAVGKPRPKLRIVNGGAVQRIAWSTQTDMPDLRYVEVDPLHLTFEQLVSDSCRYPYGEAAFTYCGHRQQEGSSYCPHHKMLCHELPWKRRTRGVAA